MEVQGLYLKPQAETRAKEEVSGGLSIGALAQDKLLLIEIIGFPYLKIKKDKDYFLLDFSENQMRHLQVNNPIWFTGKVQSLS